MGKQRAAMDNISRNKNMIVISQQLIRQMTLWINHNTIVMREPTFQTGWQILQDGNMRDIP